MKSLILALLTITALSCAPQYRVTIAAPETTACVYAESYGDWTVLQTSKPVTKSMVKTINRMPGINRVYVPRGTRYQLSVAIASQTFDSTQVINNVSKLLCK